MIISANRLLDEKFYEFHESAEISPKSGLVVQEMSKRIDEFGGAAILAGNLYDLSFSRLLRMISWLL